MVKKEFEFGGKSSLQKRDKNTKVKSYFGHPYSFFFWPF